MLRRRMYQHAFLRWLLQLLFAVLVVCTFVACQATGGVGPTASPTASATFTPTPTATTMATPTPAPTPTPFPSPSPTPPPTLAQRIDAYIAHLTLTQQIGQLLMLSVYTTGYTSALEQPLEQWDIANAIIYNQYNGGPLMPTTLGGWTQLNHDLQAHANQALIIATDEEGGSVDRLAPYYGPTPSPQSLAATGDPGRAYAQAGLDAQRLRASGVNLDFAPLADVYQGGAVDRSRMFGTTPAQVITYAGAFLNGLQQHGVEGTLKHWPGIGSAPANPDYGLPTISKSQAQLNAVDFATFRALLAKPTTCAMSSPKYSSLFLASPASSTERGSRSERREMEGMKEKRSVERRGDQAKETEEAARRSRQPVEKLSALPEDLHIFPFTSVERSASSASLG